MNAPCYTLKYITVLDMCMQRTKISSVISTGQYTVTPLVLVAKIFNVLKIWPPLNPNSHVHCSCRL